MAKSKSSKGLKNKRLPSMAPSEMKKFNSAVKGHKKLLEAIGKL